MRSVAAGLLVFGFVAALSVRARAEEPVSPAREASQPASSAELRAEERSFEDGMARFMRLWAFTQRLISERERQAFEEAASHYARFTELTRELTERHLREVEREFDQTVALYLRKREVTRELARDHAASESPVAW